ncbi:Serine/threonine protein kinase [Handroanthus impetiginosus]|uniref:Receptor-like serine/threonine-protein kinase n=1 Tax=Handroanthus impetiginosus TaxID=429701 RepID=A0A2G9G0T8_9LAMI|nr:Serine/threonine protein kinase [Handroanthus impetiginosus]
MFQLGFFSPGTSRAKFLGVCFKSTPDIAVWVANREKPIVDSKGVFTLARNGTMILTTSERELIWFSNFSRPVSDPLLQLLDTGNLVLVDYTSKEEKSFVWQSFDYPGENTVPGMKMELNKYLTSWKNADDPSPGDFTYKIENRGLSQMIILMGKRKRYRTGHWNGSFFTGLQFFSNPAWKVQTVFKNGELVSLFDPNDISYNTRFTMNYTGFIQRYIMNEQRDAWILISELPDHSCDNYGSGFVPKNAREWSVFNWGNGCRRITPLGCQKDEGFLKIGGAKFPDPLDYKMKDNTSTDECRDECLKNCNCTAYANMNISNVRSGCLMWFGDLIDVKEFTEEFLPDANFYLRVPISELKDTISRKKKRKVPTKLIFIATAFGFGMLFFGLTYGVILLRKRHKRLKALKIKREDLELPLFDLGTIAAATNHFSVENLIGEGGFGPVYKGNLSAEQVIAVKRMSETSTQGPEEFKNEVTLIAKLQHKNLVRLLGCCITGKEKLLIYEYMQHKSLDYFIFDKNRSVLLTWPKRFDIIMGIARGLLYLHHDSRLKIIHRDLKTSNILLDENLNAKISDFGLARMFKGDQTAERTKRVMGTYGYMAPEYAFDGKFSIKSDVFSMGVVMLEIVSGKKNRGCQNLLKQAWLLWKEKRKMELMDACCNTQSCNKSQVERCIQVGLLCIQNAAEDRPIMSSVVLMLSTNDTTLPLPKKPAFFLDNSCSLRQQSASRSKEFSGGEITITDLEAR